MSVPGRAADLVARADAALAAARRDIEAGDALSGADRAYAAMLALAAACLAAEPRDPDAAAAPAGHRPAAVIAAYGAAFGRGGRLYSAYFRWLLDARDLALAAAVGLAGAAEAAGPTETAVERAELFRDGVERYLARL